MTSIPDWRRRWLGLRLALAFLSVCPAVVASPAAVGPPSADQQAETRGDVSWATGSELRGQLAKEVQVTWRDVPLRDALDRLAALHRTAIFLDRRIDPGLRISLETKGASLQQTIEQLADRLDLGVAYVGPVAYLGPRFVSARLSTLAVQRMDEVKALPPTKQRVWRRRTSWAWPRLTEPRQLVADLARSHELEIENEQALPHDLWRGEKLPPMTLSEKLTLVLAGFQMSYRINADGKILLIRFPSAVAVTRSYQLPNDESLADQIRDRFPQAQIEIDQRQLAFKSTIEDHWQLEEMLGKRPPARVPRREPSEDPNAGADVVNQRYTLKIVNQPLTKAVNAVARQLHLQVQFSSDVRMDPERLVSIDVQQATFDELMEALLKPANLAHRRVGTTLQIISPQK